MEAKEEGELDPTIQICPQKYLVDFPLKRVLEEMPASSEGLVEPGFSNIPDATHYDFWINPDPGQSYTLEINLQDDDNGDDAIPDGSVADDEFQYNCIIGPSGPCATAGGGWQKVSVPLSAFTDDNSFLTGGNGVLDLDSDANGPLVNVVWAVIGTGTDASFRTDQWEFRDSTKTTGTYRREWSLSGFGLSEVFPNPLFNEGQVILQTPSTQQAEISIFDMIGRKKA